MIAKYVVRFYDETDNENHLATGSVYGRTYSECAQNLAEYFGDEAILSMNLVIPDGDNGDDVMTVDSDLPVKG